MIIAVRGRASEKGKVKEKEKEIETEKTREQRVNNVFASKALLSEKY